MAYSEKSREAEANQLLELAEVLESPFTRSALMIMSLVMQFGFDDIRIDACIQREKTFRKRILGFCEQAWTEKSITENAPFLNDLFQACNGDIKVFDDEIDWPRMARAWRTAAGWLERSSNQIQEEDSKEENQ